MYVILRESFSLNVIEFLFDRCFLPIDPISSFPLVGQNVKMSLGRMQRKRSRTEQEGRLKRLSLSRLNSHTTVILTTREHLRLTMIPFFFLLCILLSLVHIQRVVVIF